MGEIPAVSLVIPAYRHEAFVGEAIESVLGQTFGDFELIVIDDGSPDRTGEIADAYASRDSRIRVYHQANAGSHATINRGLGLARAEGALLGLLYGNYSVSTSNFFFRRTLWHAVGGLRNYRYVVDWEFALRAALHAPERFVGDREADVAQLREALALESALVAALEAKVAALEFELARVYASRSWRYTRFLRRQ